MGFSNCGSQALECKLNSCGTRVQLLRGMWDLSGPGSEPVSSALADGFLTTEPPGKSLYRISDGTCSYLCICQIFLFFMW